MNAAHEAVVLLLISGSARHLLSPRLATSSRLICDLGAVGRPSSTLDFRLRHTRLLSTTRRQSIQGRDVGQADDSATPGQQNFDDLVVEQLQDKQSRTPWHREGANVPPVRRPRSAGAMTKGKLLTTPSRLLKLVLPLTTVDKNTDRKDVQPLALLVHPQQPLSYLERLIQAELPTITTDDGRQKIPAVYFKAEDMVQDEIKPRRGREEHEEDEEEAGQAQEKGDDEVNVDGKTMRTGKIASDRKTKATVEADQTAHTLRGGPGQGGVESYSGAGQHAPDASGLDHKHHLVRWSTSTEIGDFIRDAARGKEFAVEIEDAGKEIMVGVPSFGDRTHYLRSRLRKASKRIADMATLKNECDIAAHRSAQRVALGGFGGLVSWWVGVWYLTFETNLGWDVMEPVTYLVGLSTLMGGYLWFLYHNREVSYRSALNLTVSRRQNQLYKTKGFDLEKWESLVHDANDLRREIKKVAEEYDVEWDETKDEYDELVTKALKKERENQRNKRDEDEEDEPVDEPKEAEGKK